MIKIRKSGERGYFNHGWLKSFHTFSFAEYYDANHMHFGNLRVINEDFIEANQGFGKHPHRDMEIITYVISGALSHQDSMGNASTIYAGEVQIMTAGSGVFHSEFNHEKNQETHLLQIWIFPKEKNIAPRYEQKSFSNTTGLTLVVSGQKAGESLTINQDAKIYLGKFSEQKTLDFEIEEKRKIWIQVISGKVSLGDFVANEGDALAILDEKRITLKIAEKSEFLLFDL
jgi:redox-sensitive bicupin YhaK (pirin superfamily)